VRYIQCAICKTINQIYWTYDNQDQVWIRHTVCKCSQAIVICKCNDAA